MKSRKPKAESRKPMLCLMLHVFFFVLIISIFTVNAEASIVLKAAIVNPSADLEKEVELKVPLPKEVQPEHILNLGDLELDFDAQENVYYVHKKFVIAPKDSIVREVEIMDIWLVDKRELNSIRKEAEELWVKCKNSEFSVQANFLRNNIESKISQVIELQELTTVTPQEHISNYRKNLERLQEVNADLKNLNAVAERIKPISAKTIWQLILFVVGFLALIAVVFMFVWNRYLKSPQLERLKLPEE
ncbi:MAG: hypothetical protein ABH914_01760 [Candidatus Omnitrophota bacterium]